VNFFEEFCVLQTFPQFARGDLVFRVPEIKYSYFSLCLTLFSVFHTVSCRVSVLSGRLVFPFHSFLSDVERKVVDRWSVILSRNSKQNFFNWNEYPDTITRILRRQNLLFNISNNLYRGQLVIYNLTSRLSDILKGVSAIIMVTDLRSIYWHRSCHFAYVRLNMCLGVWGSRLM
jgi:hypothetical protein